MMWARSFPAVRVGFCWVLFEMGDRHCSFGRSGEGWQFPTSWHRLGQVFHLRRCPGLVGLPSANPRAFNVGVMGMRRVFVELEWSWEELFRLG